MTDVVTEEQKSQLSAEKIEIINTRAKFVELLSIRAKDIYGSDNVNFISYPTTLQHGREPPGYIFDLLTNHNIFIAMTSFSITFSELIKKVLDKGSRGASMPLASPEMFRLEGPLAIDHNKMVELGEIFIDKFESLRLLHPNKQCDVQIIDSNRNELKFSILEEDQKFVKDFGMYHSSSSFGNLPAGEIYIAPDFYGNASGKIAIPQNCTNFCQDDDYLEITFSKGKVVETKGGLDILDEYLGFKQGPKSPESDAVMNSRRNLALFGLGLNSNATFNHTILESSKMLGSCHLGFGASSGFGGLIKSDLHLGFVIPGVDIYINKEKIVDSGIPVFEF